MQRGFHVRTWSANVGAHLIGIDGSRATTRQPTGTERYSVELLAALAELDPSDPIRVYLNSSTIPVGLRYPGEARCLPAKKFWSMRTLSSEMRHHPPHVLFVPSYVIPPIHPASVVTIHDLGYLVEPKAHDPGHRQQLVWTTKWSCRSAAKIIAVSDSTRIDLIERLHIHPERVETIHLGVTSDFFPQTDEAIGLFRARHRLPERFVLAVGTIHPRKNLVRLAQAMNQLATVDPNLQLVIAGTSGWQSDEIVREINSTLPSGQLRLLGYTPENELPLLYSAATITAFVSLYEGFGLPAIESMACGTPVIASNTSSLPEVCDVAAVLVDPTKVDEIADGMARLLTDTDLRRTTIQRGLARAASFRWDTNATQTLAVLREVHQNALN